MYIFVNRKIGFFFFFFFLAFSISYHKLAILLCDKGMGIEILAFFAFSIVIINLPFCCAIREWATFG